MIPYVEFTTISLGPVTIYVWGLLVALGFIAGSLLLLKLGKEEKLDEKDVSSLFFWIFVASMIGARLAYVLLFWSQYSSNPIEVFYVWDGGLVFLGGLLGALPVGILLVRKRLTISFWRLADLLAPALALGLTVGRCGCCLINDHPGSVTDVPWGIEWPDGVVRHPVAQYLVVLNLVLLLLMLWARKKPLFHKIQGAVAWIYLLGYGVGRFVLDFTRAVDGTYADPRYAGLTISQYVSLVFVIVAVVLIIRNWKRISSLTSKNAR